MIKKQIHELFPQWVQWRRWFHQHPELSFQETQTAERVSVFLQELGLEVRTQVGGMGVTGLLRGKEEGPTIALRADMDALPIQDEKKSSYRSTVPGVMHACGHDGHMTMLMGTAQILSNLRDQLHGNVLFIFQHAEEMPPGGAIDMVKAGVLEDVDRIYGAHLWTPLPVGTVAIRAGEAMAAADKFSIKVTEKGGHGGIPQDAIDAVMIASHIVVNLQSIISREVDPLQSGVITVGSIQGGKAFNVIAETCQMNGTVRSFRPEVREWLAKRIDEVAQQTCAMFGATCEIDYQFGYPALVNDPEETELIRQVGREVVGEKQVLDYPAIMGAEDFSHYLRNKPGAFVFIGASNPEVGMVAPHHHPLFDIDEEAMKIGVEVLTQVALKALCTISDT